MSGPTSIKAPGSTGASPAPGTGAPGAGALLQLMRDGQPRTRAELIEITGLARSTVGARVESLLAAGLLTPAGESRSTGGRPPTRLAFNPEAGFVLGADLGATHVTVALTDLGGRVVAETSEALDIRQGPEVVLDAVVEIGKSLLRSAGHTKRRLVGVGLGLPGPVEHSTGRPASPPIMPGWDGYDVPAHVSAKLGGPVLVDNDVNIMALGEHATSYPHVEHLVFVKVATGIGAGIISSGQLHRGAQGSAGDLGHVAAPHGEGIICRCGNEGCLEAVASGPAIVARLAEQGIEVKDSRALLELSRSGSPEAVAALRQAGREIGAVLASIVSLLNPSVIAIGGLLAQSNDGLLAGIREVVYGRSLPLATGELQIVAARTGDHAGVIGAATMVIQHVLSADEVERHLASWAS
ncbi:transcriptional regulator, ROK family protein [Janibacter sp. HTCC2649]|uniref:ROK family transcriptional regulator n=1 Tax=Janibacter sp. HTCC2649 TaxID=313589 RepID=UPI0000670C38|nr:ROK family transcriptional regulator [Janibacter sp. HTCC2649]EAQ00571.1 transcriptional regulator, ROK family protein [Janibacter sp. HTCC2649]